MEAEEKEKDASVEECSDLTSSPLESNDSQKLLTDSSNQLASEVTKASKTASTTAVLSQPSNQKTLGTRNLGYSSQSKGR